MAGIGNIGSFGMTASQFKTAMISTSGFAAQGTGTAKQFNNKMEEQQLQQKQDGVSISENALTLSQDAEELQENQKADQQKELQKNNQEDHKVGEDMSQATQMFGEEDEGFEQKLKSMRMKHNMGHAAMATGAKPKESEKAENKTSMANVAFANMFKSNKQAPAEAASSNSNDIQSFMFNLNQASQLGILESEAKKLKSKADEKESLRKLALSTNHNIYQGSNASELNNSQTINKASEIKAEPAIDKVQAEDIARIMNRTPEEILADVPVQFQATAKIMVTGQVNEVGEPKPSLTEMKTEPKTESQMMELLPAPTAGEIEVAEMNTPAMQLEFPEEIPA